MPHNELAVVVNVVRDTLVNLDEVLITVLGSSVAALGRLAEQALDGVDIVLLLSVRAVVPLHTIPGLATCRLASEGSELGLRNHHVRLVLDHLGDVGEGEHVDLVRLVLVKVELRGSSGDVGPLRGDGSSARRESCGEE